MVRQVLVGALSCSIALASLGMFGCSSGSSDLSAAEETATRAAQQEQEAESNAKYEVSIDACDMATDFEGNPAIVVTYTWTNNSDDSQMFDVAIDDKAFQNGVELSFATLSFDNDVYDMTASMKEVQPGGTQTVYQAFLLDDQSEVVVQCTELISFDDTVLAEQTFTVA